MLAFNKPNGGIRPIAIGTTFRRLVTKLICQIIKSESGRIFRPQQLGFGTQMGCEKIIHTVRSFIHSSLDSENILLKLDFKNAFNTIERDIMLKSFQEKFPDLYPFVWQSYRYPTNLFYDSKLILSQIGCQQGDPLGPLLFSLFIQPLVQQLNSQLNLFYLDDGTLGGDPKVVLSDLQEIIKYGSEIGLELNPSKCELFFCSGIDQSILTSFQTIAPGIKIVSKSNLSILGSPIFLDYVEELASKN